MLSSSSSSRLRLGAALDHVLVVFVGPGLGLVGDLFLFLDGRAGGLLADLALAPPSSPSSLSAICSAVGPLDSMASRSRISRSCMRPSLSAFDQSMMALKVIGLSHRPQIMMSRPASMRLAMAISPSRESSSTAPISRRYMRTGSSVRSTASFLVAAAGRGPPSSSGSTSSSAGSSSFSSSSSDASSFSTTLMPMSLIADMTSSICSDAIWSWGRASLSSSIGDEAALLGAGDHLLDRRVVEVDQRGIAAVAVSRLLLLRFSPCACSTGRLVGAGERRQPLLDFLLRRDAAAAAPRTHPRRLPSTARSQPARAAPISPSRR